MNMVNVKKIRYGLGLMGLGLFVLLGIILPLKGTATNLDTLALPIPSSCTTLPPTAEFLQQQEEFKTLYHQPDFSLFQQALANNAAQYNNLGGSLVQFPQGQKQVFRGSILSNSPDCLQQLVKEKGVKTIVNLYSGNLINEDQLANQERDFFQKLGGDNYLHILNFSDSPDPNKNQTLATIKDRIAQIIQAIAASPGNIYVHCVGGIHRTGEVYGILQKCVNRVPMAQVLADYEKHAGGTRQNNREYRPANVEILQTFDCQRLDRLGLTSPK
ncbi:MAG: tyrosine-protein phosphatase [Microcystaceae cyanobacterium]